MIIALSDFNLKFRILGERIKKVDLFFLFYYFFLFSVHSPATEILLDDVKMALLSREEFDLFTNEGFGTWVNEQNNILNSFYFNLS